jgi:anti-repressor protein
MAEFPRMTESIESLFKGRDIRVLRIAGETWWEASSLCTALGYTDVDEAVGALDDDEKSYRLLAGPGGVRHGWVVTEPGMYSLVLGSDSPVAQPFQRWVGRALASISRTGGYTEP